MREAFVILGALRKFALTKVIKATTRDLESLAHEGHRKFGAMFLDKCVSQSLRNDHGLLKNVAFPGQSHEKSVGA